MSRNVVGPSSRPSGGDAHAAVANFGLESGRHLARGPHAREDALEEVKVHLADQVAVVDGEAVERTVRQRDRPAIQVWLVAVSCENVEERVLAILAVGRGRGGGST